MPIVHVQWIAISPVVTQMKASDEAFGHTPKRVFPSEKVLLIMKKGTCLTTSTSEDESQASEVAVQSYTTYGLACARTQSQILSDAKEPR